MRGQRCAVVKFCLPTQREAIRQTIVGDANTARGKPVHGIGLVARAHHEARKRKLHALRGVAFENVAIEGIEGLE